MPPRPRGSNGGRTSHGNEGSRSSALPGTSRCISRRSNPRKPPSAPTQGITIKVEDTTSDTMSTEDEFSTDDYSSEDDITSSDSEDMIVRSKNRPMINLPPGR